MRPAASAALAAALLACTAPAAVSAKKVTLSNTALPLDTNGNPLITGEATMLQSPVDGSFYAFMNDWGGCPGIDCCDGSHGCAYCCFQFAPYTDPCVYTTNHSVG